jgi:RNA polymerase sigma-70 factor (ECF subfamily)
LFCALNASPAAIRRCQQAAGGAPVGLTRQSDEKLMSRIARREGEALAELYDRYAPRVFGLCLRIVNEKQLAEDLLQEVFVRLWERSHLFERSRGSVSAWLMGIARNLCIDQLRRLQARPQIAEPAANSDRESPPLEESLPDPLADVAGAAASNDRAALIRRALAGLSREQQLVIELSYFRGYTRREIARRLDWPEGTVHTRARLALQNLRDQLGRLGLGPDDLE